MHGDVTLKDIQPVVFENISNMIEELDQSQTVKSFSAETLEDNPSLNAVNLKPSQKTFRGGFNRGRGNVRSAFTNRGANKLKSSRNTLSSNKFCRICNLAGSGPQIYLSHEIGECGRLSQRDLESIKGALVLNGLIDVPIDDFDTNDPSYSPQPGWDELEEQLQDEGQA